MSYTTADYLAQLQQDREDLVDNLETQGITGLSGDETFTELVPEVLNISGGGGVGVDWSTLGYSSVPQLDQDAFNYSKNIYDNWDPTITSMNTMYMNNTDLKVFPLVDTSNVTNMNEAFRQCTFLTDVPLLNTSSVTNMYGAFSNCVYLKTVPMFNSSKTTTMRNMFSRCNRLENVPILNTSSIDDSWSLVTMFEYCPNLTDASLDNILQMCINATSYPGTKTLARLGITDTTVYPASRIEALPHYQDFIDAGWTIS